MNVFKIHNLQNIALLKIIFMYSSWNYWNIPERENSEIKVKHAFVVLVIWLDLWFFVINNGETWLTKDMWMRSAAAITCTYPFLSYVGKKINIL